MSLQRLTEFSDEQQIAVDNNAPLLVVRSGAGSGKTRVLVGRCERLVTQGVAPESILVTTFSVAAAEEIMHRFALSPIAQLMGRIYVGTIHAWCWQMLRQYLPIYERYDVLDAMGQFVFLSRWWNDLRLENVGLQLNQDVKTALSLFSVTRLGDVQWNKSESRPAADLLARYRARMEAEAFVDYEEMLTQFVDAMQCEELIAALSKIQHVIVDEAQDIDPVQARILSNLHRNNTNLCLIGDTNQSLFRWRGCSPKILDFAVQKGSVCTLRTNWRSTAEIAALADDVLHSLYELDAGQPRLAARDCVSGNLRAVHFGAAKREAEWVANDIAERIGTVAADGARLLRASDFAVLGRTNNSLVPFAASLRQRGVPCTAGIGQSTLATPEVRLSVQWMLYLAGRTNITPKMLHNSLRNGLRGISSENVDRALIWAQQMRHQLDDLRAENDMTWQDENQAVSEDTPDVEQSTPDHDLQRLFQSLISQSGAALDHLTDGLAVHRTWAVFSKFVASFDILHADLPAVRRLAHFAAYISSPLFQRNGLPTSADAGEEDAVSLVTIHDAKGREWESVYLPGLREGQFPLSRSADENWYDKGIWTVLPPSAVPNPRRWTGEEIDEKYLLYVAVTRSKRYLTASWSPLGKRKVASPFFDFFACHPRFALEKPR